MKNIAAFTQPSGASPPFISVNLLDGDKVRISVRAPLDPAQPLAQAQAHIDLALADYVALVVSMAEAVMAENWMAQVATTQTAAR